MASTYEAIATYTVPSAQSSYTFTLIPSTFTDLVLVMNLKGATTANYPIMELNGDTGNNYSETWLMGNGSSATSTRYSNTVGYLIGNDTTSTSDFSFNCIVHIQNYSNSTTYKTALVRNNNAAVGVEAGVLLWRNTNAITQVAIRSNANNFATGSTFTLYGIKAA